MYKCLKCEIIMENEISKEATLKGNIVIAPPWWDEETQRWLEWIPWDEY